MTRDWNAICAWTLDQVQSIPYKPGLRWCFYRALEQFSLTKDDWSGFKAAVARRRKRFQDGWRPDTLADTIRYPLYAGFGPASWERYRDKMIEDAPGEGLWTALDLLFYTEVWYEAEAMTGQFETYVQEPWRISLRPFRGDFTIAPKWEAAKHLERMVESGRRVDVIYFGDADAKGAQIPLSAIRDIKAWAGDAGDRIHFHIGGLTVEQAVSMRLPQNFERPGQWQWEALSDEQARGLIMNALEAVLPMPVLAAGIERADKRRAEWLQEASERLKD